MIQHFDLLFVGGGLSARMFLKQLGKTMLSIGIIDPHIGEQPHKVHWSYWSSAPSFYDQFAIGSWQSVRTGQGDKQPIAPLHLRLVRSSDVLSALAAEYPDVTSIAANARSINLRPNGSYLVETDGQTYSADWVFDSAVHVRPVFPAGQPQAWLSGSGLIVRTEQPVFMSDTAILFDPLPGSGFAYVLPLSSTEALVESAYFQKQPQEDNKDVLSRYITNRFDARDMQITHHEYGIVPLGFAPDQTAGPRHILLGAKRGLVKPSAGYGIVRIEQESQALARRFKHGKPLPISHHYRQPWQLMDKTFIQLVNANPTTAQQLMRQTLERLPLRDALGFLDEKLPPLKMARLMTASFPLVSPFITQHISQEIARHSR